MVRTARERLDRPLELGRAEPRGLVGAVLRVAAHGVDPTAGGHVPELDRATTAGTASVTGRAPKPPLALDEAPERIEPARPLRRDRAARPGRLGHRAVRLAVSGIRLDEIRRVLRVSRRGQLLNEA